MSAKIWILLCGAAVVALAETCWSQEASHWRVYKVADGLTESSCASVTAGLNGRVLTTHLNSETISELDGYTVSTIPWPGADGSRVCETPGGQIWALAPEGFREWKNDAWVLHPVPEVAAELRNNPTRLVHPIPFCPLRQGRLAFLLPDRLVEFNVGDTGLASTAVLLTAEQTRIGLFSGMTMTREGGLWIAGGHGLIRLTGPIRRVESETGWREHPIPSSLEIQNFREPQEDPAGAVTGIAESTTDGKRMAVRFDGQHWTALSAGAEKIRYAWTGPDKAVAAATIDALFRWPEGGLVEDEEIAARQYFDIAVAPDGAVWLATSDGLFRYALPAWRTPAPVQKLSAYVYCVADDALRRLWFVANGRLQVMQNDSCQEFPLPDTAQRPQQCSLFPLKNGSLLLGLGDDLIQFHPDSGDFSAVQKGGVIRQCRVLGRMKDDGICVQSFAPGSAKETYGLEVYDGAQFQACSFPHPDASMGAELSVLMAAQNGDLWLGGDRGVARCHNQKWQTFVSTEKTGPERVICFAELADGKIWCATPDTVWEFDSQKWSIVRGGFDHINTLLRARDDTIRVASNSGVFRYFRGAWIENGPEEGLPSMAVHQVYEDQDGRIWAATARGLSLYHPDADPYPPQTYIQPLADKDLRISEGGTINLAFSGQDKWRYTPRERLLYAYRLDQGDWSALQEATTASFTDLSAGKHYFQVRAADRNGNVDPSPARLEFTVALPWYKEPRLVVIAFIGLAAALFFAVLAFNRHRQLLRSYAAVEKKVAERTRDLEIANRGLLLSQKMNALGTLAAGIAHDFNNILSIIKGSAQIIEANPDDPQKIRTRVDRIKTVVEQGSGIVKAMLGFSRDSDGQLSWCDANGVVDDTLKLLGDQFLRKVEVQFERAPNLSEVRASKDFIQQILLNFIFNAAESRAERQQVIVATRQLSSVPEGVGLMPAPAAAYVAISVRDFGCGITPENLPRIFDPFFTTKSLSTRRGTGLGLWMAYELAKRMKAGLAVESVVEQGSTFTLFLPVRELSTEVKP